MRVFITGASGYIGSVVSEALLQAMHSVAGLARSDESAQKLASREVGIVRGSLGDTEGLAAAARNADAVIHLASDGQNAAQTDPAAVAAILDALEGTDKPFIYTGGVLEIGDTHGEIVDETAPDNPTPLVAWRPAVTRAVLAAAERGIRTVVIRPAIVFGRNGSIPAMLSQSAKKEGAAHLVGDGQNRWPFVHVDDLADLYLRALNAPAGTLLMAAAGPSYRSIEVAEAASRGAGADGAVRLWPLEEARKAMGAFADALVLDQQVSGKRAQELLGWDPEGPSILTDLERGSYAQHRNRRAYEDN